MRTVENVLASRLQEMLSNYPEQEALSLILFDEIMQMLQEDFDAVSQKSKRLNLVYSCVISVLKQAREKNVRKKYATDLLDVFLNKDIAAYLNKILGQHTENCIFAIRAARSELHASQWSDPTSKHWQRAIDHLQQ